MTDEGRDAKGRVVREDKKPAWFVDEADRTPQAGDEGAAVESKEPGLVAGASGGRPPDRRPSSPGTSPAAPPHLEVGPVTGPLDLPPKSKRMIDFVLEVFARRGRITSKEINELGAHDWRVQRSIGQRIRELRTAAFGLVVMCKADPGDKAGRVWFVSERDRLKAGELLRQRRRK